MGNEDESKVTCQNTLLDGEYDAEESRRSFLEALNNWKGTEFPKKYDDAMCDTETKMEPVNLEIDIKFEQQQTYFDKLLKSKIRTQMSEKSHRPSQLQTEPQETQNSDEEWNESDEEALKSLITNINLKTNKAPSPEPVEVNIHQEQELIISNIMIEDVTDFEDRYLKEAFDSGRMIECIPFSKLKIFEDRIQTQEFEYTE
jgi:hypothetical protein